jgi:alkanesulfonate monooxygenase SsuD/methylene tetrahydromethanopterin reductase-like flavin-dependent oxidoreductase (luciferase family)
MSNPPVPFTVSLAVPRGEVLGLVSSPDLSARLDQLGLAFLAFGLERFSDRELAGPGLDPTTVVTFLARRFARTGVVSAYAPHRDHPYNIARRAASSDHIVKGRSGIILGFRDHALTAGDAWGGDGLQPPIPLTRESVADAAAAIQKLWQSFPVESIVADRGTRQFVDASQIRRIDHEGAYRIAGPLSVPTTPQGTPVLLGYVSSHEDLELLRDSLDVAVLSAGAAEAPLGESGGVRAIREAAFDPRDGGVDDLSSRLAQARESGAAGVLVTLTGNTTLGEFAEILESHSGRLGLSTGREGQTLRSILGLPRGGFLLNGARGTFPAQAG